MKITEIAVRVDTRFNDPYEQFRNHCPAVEMRAVLDEGESVALSLGNLQMLAKHALADARQDILRQRWEEVKAAETARRIEGAKDNVANWRLTVEHDEERLQKAKKLQSETITPEYLEERLISEGDERARRNRLVEQEEEALARDRETLRDAEARLKKIEAGEDTDIPF